MKFRAVIRNERTGECRWFVYVETEHGGCVYACRFGQRRHAARLAAAMNGAWAAEGHLLDRGEVNE